MIRHERLPHTIMVPYEGIPPEETGEVPEEQAQGCEDQGVQQRDEMSREYVHQELDEEFAVPSGYYTLFKELRLKHNGREVLCVTGAGVLECSCCAGGYLCAGRGGLYALVPGYIVSWKSRGNEAGLPVSEVEPIDDEKTRRDVAAAIRESERIQNIEFW